MAIQRKEPPKPVQWDQQSILRAIRDFAVALVGLGGTTTNPSSDTEAVVTRNIRDHELLAGLDANTHVLRQIEQHLSFMTEVDLGGHDASS